MDSGAVGIGAAILLLVGGVYLIFRRDDLDSAPPTFKETPREIPAQPDRQEFGFDFDLWNNWDAQKTEPVINNLVPGGGNDSLDLINALNPIKALPRGIRNNNPGNIRYTATPWRGLANPASDGEFCIFVRPEYGIRAMAKILASYEKRGVDTLSEIISAWAPAVENNTQSYILFVSAKTGISPIDIVGRHRWPVLLAAIITQENGIQPYTMELIKSGVEMA